MEKWKIYSSTEKPLGTPPPGFQVCPSATDAIRKGTATSAGRAAERTTIVMGRRTSNRNTRTGDPCTIGQKSNRVPPVSALRHFVAAEGADDVSWGNRPLTLRPATVSLRATTTGRSTVLAKCSWRDGEWGVRTAPPPPPPPPPRVFRFCVFCTVVTDSLIRSDIWRFPRTRSHHVARQCYSRCSAVRMFMIRDSSSCYVFNPMGL